MKEVKFIGGVFFDFEVPREKCYLFKYFRSPLERQFVRYYLCFGEFEYFTEHTGYYCQKRWLRILKKRFDKVTEFHQKCKSEMELETLEQLEKGKIKFKR